MARMPADDVRVGRDLAMISRVETRPLVLSDRGADTLRALETQWASGRTFVCLPEKSSIPSEWVDRALDDFPLELQENHFCMLTSGTTGNPKLVVGKMSRAEHLAAVLHELQESEPVRETIVTLPLSYCYAFVNQWVWARITGRRLNVTAGLSQPDVLRDSLRRADNAMVCLVGAQVPLLGQLYGNEQFPGVIRIHFAGGRFPQEQLPLLHRMFPNSQIFNNYGCAEAMPRLCLRKAEHGDQASDIGTPLPGVSLRTDAEGNLLFLSDYRIVAQADSAGIRMIPDDQWIPSGDLASQLPGGHWQVLGRTGEVFKRYGEKITVPQIMSTVLKQWDGQLSFYRDRDGAGEEGYVLVLAPAPSSNSVQALLQTFRTQHPRTHWPLRIESVDAMPQLPNGKVDPRALKDLSGKAQHWRQRI